MMLRFFLLVCACDLVGCGASGTEVETGPVGTRDTPLAEAPATPVEAAEGCELESVFYDFDEVQVRADQMPVLEANAACYARRAAAMGCPATLVIVGHTDERGTDEYNLMLGERVARGVAKVLIGLGVPKDQVVTRSAGEGRPLVPNANAEAGHARNRRVELQIEACP